MPVDPRNNYGFFKPCFCLGCGCDITNGKGNTEDSTKDIC